MNNLFDVRRQKHLSIEDRKTFQYAISSFLFLAEIGDTLVDLRKKIESTYDVRTPQIAECVRVIKLMEN